MKESKPGVGAIHAKSAARAAAQAAKAHGTRTTCCGVHYRSGCRHGCINFAANGAARELVWS